MFVLLFDGLAIRLARKGRGQANGEQGNENEIWNADPLKCGIAPGFRCDDLPAGVVVPGRPSLVLIEHGSVYRNPSERKVLVTALPSGSSTPTCRPSCLWSWTPRLPCRNWRAWWNGKTHPGRRGQTEKDSDGLKFGQ